MKHEDPGGDRDPAAPPRFPPRPAKASRARAALKSILVSNKAGHRVLLPVVSLSPSLFAAGDGQRRSSLGSAAGAGPV